MVRSSAATSMTLTRVQLLMVDLAFGLLTDESRGTHDHWWSLESWIHNPTVGALTSVPRRRGRMGNQSFTFRRNCLESVKITVEVHHLWVCWGFDISPLSRQFRRNKQHHTQ
jgi:hypothetical protein